MIEQRHRPGDPAPAKDKYEVVDHFGERLNVEVLCEEGDRLPLIAIPGFNPIWFVRTGEDEAATTA